MSTARLNEVRACLLLEELVRCGVECFFIAPGSRSTPLVAAVAKNPGVRSVVHYDERGAAFAALGYARATGRAAAWITTSGTAVANGMPAVVEASVDEVPMILLTADRPPELRDTSANQTIDQPNIFGGYVRWRFDLPAPDPAADETFVLTTVDQAAHRARRAPSGPVHLNAMFREPLLPDPDEDDDPTPPETGPLARWRAADRPYTHYPDTRPTPPPEEFEGVAREFRGVRRGLVVAGRLKSREQGVSAGRLAKSLGWPLLTDVASQARLGASPDTHNRVHNYDLLLADERFRGSHGPDAVLYIGAPGVSKRLGGFLNGGSPGSYTVVRDSPVRTDPFHRATRIVESDVSAFCEALVAASDPLDNRSEGWLSSWKTASRDLELRVEEALSLDPRETLNEPFVAREVSRLIPAGHGLVVASSMPVRDVDMYAVPDGAAASVVVNRGASGIDGTVATAAGHVIGGGGAATLLIGDLALLHDLNSLALLRDLPVTVVAINNDGGGIFSMLPVARHESFFERYFGTPHGLGFEDAARMFGLDYESPRTPEEFRDAYRGASSSGGPSLIEIKTDREVNTALRRGLVAGTASNAPSLE